MRTRPIRNANGPAIRALRRAHGLKQHELATLAGVSAGYLSSIEKQHCDASPWVLNKLAEALRVSRAAIAADPEEVRAVAALQAVAA